MCTRSGATVRTNRGVSFGRRGSVDMAGCGSSRSGVVTTYRIIALSMSPKWRRGGTCIFSVIGVHRIRRSSSCRANDMRDDQHQFLSLLGRLPARLTAEQVAWAINCQPHDVPVLVAAHLLKPLGNPLPNGVKYFATVEVVELMEDRAWLAKLTTAVSQGWQKKNQRKSQRSLIEMTAATGN